MQAREQALTQLMVHDDYAMTDAELALLAGENARAQTSEPAAAYDALIARLSELVRIRNEQLAKRRDTSRADRRRKAIGEPSTSRTQFAVDAWPSASCSS
jgi:hypothetical protein